MSPDLEMILPDRPALPRGNFYSISAHLGGVTGTLQGRDVLPMARTRSSIPVCPLCLDGQIARGDELD
jgi:hypothetical protein